MNADPLGRGLSTPLRLGTEGLAQAAGVAKVEQSIRVVLGTAHGERVMRPRFGCRLRSLAFAPNTVATANLARYYVLEGLERWEPRIEVVDVVVLNDDRAGTLLIDISYRIRATQQTHDLRYTFPLERP